MQWPDDFANELPAPRDDEPESLRQDIADELADHLECAFVRELHQTRDEPTARNNVLDRFGNPSQVARKLWLDAMWERIMSQRILVAALAIMGLASLASTGLMWKQMERSQELQQAMLAESRTATAALLEQTQAANRELAVQARESNAALLAKLGELASTSRSPAASPASLEWNPVKVRLYSGEKPGIPAPNFKVTLRGYVLDTAKEVSITRQSDETGVVDLGLIRPGQHTLDVVSPWGETLRRRHITVLPGQPLLIEIASPAAQREPATVIFHPDLPSEFKENKCWMLVHFTAEPRILNESAWTLGTEQSQLAAVISPTGQARWLPLSQRGNDRAWDDYPFMLTRNSPEKSGVVRLENVRQTSQKVSSNESGGEGDTPRPIVTGIHSRYNLILPDLDAQESLSVPEGKLRLSSILLAGPPPSSSTPGRPII